MRTKEKHREYNLQYYRKRRERFIQQLGGKCAMCGSTEHLEFDHIDKESKKAGIAQIMTYKIEDVEEELKKCQLLCKKCHIAKSKEHKDLHSKLSTQEALAIRADYADTTLTQADLSRKYKLSLSEVRMILRGDRWKELTNDVDMQNRINKKRAVRATVHRTYTGCVKHPKAVDKIDINSGIILNTYECLRDVEKDGFKSGAVVKCCQGKFKQHHGYKWKYHDVNMS